ncbi:MAG: hypothetical protein AAF623_18110, partial [Planctomycetota bacterium]
RKPDDQISLAQLRLMLSFGVLLGRDKVWPAEEKKVLQELLTRIRRYQSLPDQSGKKSKPKSIAEHQAQAATSKVMQNEIEIVRRHIGISKKKSPIKTPVSWGKFWQ